MKPFPHSLVGLCAAAFLVTFSSASLAEYHGRGDRHDPARRIEHRLERISSTVALTPEQSIKIRQILLDGETKTMALRHNKDLTPEARHQQHFALRQSTKAAIEAVLTSQQRTAMQAAKVARQNQRIEDRLQRLKIALSLSEEQAGKIKAILQDTAKRAATLHDQHRARTKAPTAAEREAMHQQRLALHESTQAAIAAVLTPAQRETFAAHRSHHRDRHGDRHHGRHHGRGHGHPHDGDGEHDDDDDLD